MESVVADTGPVTWLVSNTYAKGHAGSCLRWITAGICVSSHSAESDLGPLTKPPGLTQVLSGVLRLLPVESINAQRNCKLVFDAIPWTVIDQVGR